MKKPTKPTFLGKTICAILRTHGKERTLTKAEKIHWGHSQFGVPVPVRAEQVRLCTRCGAERIAKSIRSHRNPRQLKAVEK